MNSAASATLALIATLVAGIALRPMARRADSPGGARSGAVKAQPRSRRARITAEAIAYPDALDLVVLAVRAGHLPSAAVTATLPHLPTPVAPAFAAVAARVDRGERFADALAELPERLGVLATGLADTLASADRYGLPLAPVLERLADEARRQRRRRNEVLARQLPVRLAAPLVLCTLPSFVLLAVIPLLLSALSSLSH